MTTLASFAFAPSLTPYNTAPTTYLAGHPSISGLIVSAVVLHKDTHNPRVLLIQRAAHDGFPLKWECPGGGLDTTDATILHALCREVTEETGLVMTHIQEVVDTTEFEGKEGGKWRKVTFLVSVMAGENGGIPEVKLNAEEHVDAVWVTEGDVLASRAEGREIVFAYPAQRQTVLGVLRGFAEVAEVRNG